MNIKLFINSRSKIYVTPLQLAKEVRYDDTSIAMFTKFGDIRMSYPIDSYVNVLLVGNPGGGKSTLSHVNDTASFTLLGSFRNVGGVVLASFLVTELQHRTLGEN